MRKISSSSVVLSTFLVLSWLPSSSSPVFGLPGLSSMNASPSRVFWRRIALLSRGMGAYLALSSISTRVLRGALVQRALLDLADVHAGQPDVGLLDQRGGLGHHHGDPVALRLQRHRAAEGQPQEQQDAHAREREGDHPDHLSDAGGLLDHSSTPWKEQVPKLAASSVVEDRGRAARADHRRVLAHERRPGRARAGRSPLRTSRPQRVRRRRTPWASPVLCSETPFWAVQASQ